jgi:EmrB/QacA subfamily drug resistance transporter
MNRQTESSLKSKKRGILIAGLIVAMLFGALDGTIVGTAMPRIVGELGGLGKMTWLTTAYMLTSTAIVPIAGKLADLLGRRSIYLAGFAVFIVGSALCGLSESMDQLILFRGMQGIGGGIMMPMAMIVIGDLFTGEQRAKWQGLFGGIFGLASIIGPQVGGWIVDSLNWRWVFYINLPVGIIAMILIFAGLESRRSDGPVKIDIKGMITMTAGVVSFLLALTFGGKEYAWTSWQILGLFALAAVSFAAFGWVESRAEEPIFPLHLFKNRVFLVLSGVGFLMAVGMFGAISFVPLFMQGIVGISAADSGTVMIPMMVAMMIASMIGGRIVYKIGLRVQMAAGMSIMLAGFWLLSTMGEDTTQGVAMGYMVVLGTGIGLVMPIITLALQESFPRTELGVVTSSNQFFRQIGGTFGMTAMGAVMNHQSEKLLSDQLASSLETLPLQFRAMAEKFLPLMKNDPQALYSMLLSPDALRKIPAAMQQVLVPVLKNSLVSALHDVFLFGAVFVLLGLLIIPLLGKIRLSRKQEVSVPGEAVQQ